MGSAASKTFRCPRCSGSGVLPQFVHVNGGVCFECAGVGAVQRTREPSRWAAQNKADRVWDRGVAKVRARWCTDDNGRTVQQVGALAEDGRPVLVLEIMARADNSVSMVSTTRYGADGATTAEYFGVFQA